jgi:SAM-dependent methyltransferase
VAGAETDLSGPAEAFFRSSGYWRAWSEVPDITADIPYALTAVTSRDIRVLDVPCGRGRLLKTIGVLFPGIQLYGIDVNHEMALQTRRDVRGARVAAASVYALPFPDESFDVVLCHQAFMHFEHPARALTELARLARSTVYFSVTTGRQLNTLVRRLAFLGLRGVPHWTYNVEDLPPLLPASFEWTVVGAFLFGQKALRLSHAAHLKLHRMIGRHVPQRILRRYGQTLFVYGRRRQASAPRAAR